MTHGNDPPYPSEDNNATIEQRQRGYGEGLTEREAFAMAAMQGLMACDSDELDDPSTEGIAEIAVDMADDLIAELNKGAQFNG